MLFRIVAPTNATDEAIPTVIKPASTKKISVEEHEEDVYETKGRCPERDKD